MENMIDHLSAWTHFYSSFRNSQQWGELSMKEKNELAVADMDSRKERTDKLGKPFGLGFRRVERLLNKYAPGKYKAIKVHAFVINE